VPDWKDFLGVTPLLGFFVICAWVYWKGLPNWERVRLAEIELRKKEIEFRKEELAVRREEATSVGKLSDVFKVQADATEELKIFLRAAMRDRESFNKRLLILEGAMKRDNGQVS